jgi:hypothetical protein
MAEAGDLNRPSAGSRPVGYTKVMSQDIGDSRTHDWFGGGDAESMTLHARSPDTVWF